MKWILLGSAGLLLSGCSPSVVGLSSFFPFTNVPSSAPVAEDTATKKKSNHEIRHYYTDPFAWHRAMIEDMDRRFVNRWNSFDTLFESNLSAFPFNMYEQDDTLIVELEVPSTYTKENIAIDLNNQTLTITGKQQNDQKTEDRAYLYQQRSSGSFTRQIRLPYMVQKDPIARIKNGLLTIEFEKDVENTSQVSIQIIEE